MECNGENIGVGMQWAILGHDEARPSRRWGIFGLWVETMVSRSLVRLLYRRMELFPRAGGSRFVVTG